ncbi:uncharacterized protein EV420DRAFT_1516966 [Desarmillaria tabescens]|uniref:WD40 repeat-like protein n=1 Tax=Armillaria tabescens TaxID=1929756 RepID=A0AA39NFL0_ARMTA|nr:uncharacterized protein EV420DRAFT_1516966 [Desarmillaria tabescens]KAK0464558.1 hypothetical protein EV420DRAFT_1516966 [Desarmillaria tabescens]
MSIFQWFKKRPSEHVASDSRKRPRSTTAPLPGAEGSKDKPFVLLSDDDDDELPAFSISQSPTKPVVASTSRSQKHTPQPSSSSHHKVAQPAKRPTAPAKHLKYVPKLAMPSQDDCRNLPRSPGKPITKIVAYQKRSTQSSVPLHRQSNEPDNVEDEYVKGTWTNPNIWARIRAKSGGDDSGAFEPFASLESAPKRLPPCERRLRLTNRPFQSQAVPRAPPNERPYIWDILKDTEIAIPSRRARHPHKFALEGKGPARRTLPYGSITQRWHYAAAGPINKIIQHKGCIAACSATAGGSAGETDCTYNKSGALLLWCQDEHITLKVERDPDEEDEEHEDYTEHYWRCQDGFKRVLEKHGTSEGRQVEYEYSNNPNRLNGWKPNYLYKYFSVNDIAFDPKSQCFASSGEDTNVRLWPFSSDIQGEQLRTTISKLWIYTDIFSESRRHEELSIADRQPGRHTVGAFVWGRGPTANCIFASSEPLGNSLTGVGYHKTWNPYDDSDPIYEFDDAQEAGDAMSINSEGSWLALFTAGEPDRHLRLYDIRNRHNRASKHIILDQPNAGRADLEVNCASFSPDGRFLAVSRNDNKTHIYDLRMLDKGAMISFGVVYSEWVTQNSNGRMALITGGEDGMVRMWDPTVSSNDGTVLVEMNSDIAHFSIGDRLKGEYDLVVGDAQGIVAAFDTHASHFEKIETI